MNYDITTLIVFSVALLNVTVNLVCGVLVLFTAPVSQLLLFAYPVEVMRPRWMTRNK